MIVKGIIESVVDRNNIKVRIPFLNGLKDQVDSTPTEDLPNATICQLPNVNYKLATGDVVWVNFENTRWEEPVIVGFLNIEQNTKTSYIAEELEVTQQAKLPHDTKIGDVEAESLNCLKGLNVDLAPYFANNMQVYPLDLTEYDVYSSSPQQIPLSVIQSIPRDAFIVAVTLSPQGSLIYWQLLERSLISQSTADDSQYDNPYYDYIFFNPYGLLKIEGGKVTVA